MFDVAVLIDESTGAGIDVPDETWERLLTRMNQEGLVISQGGWIVFVVG
jgi:hypothetical protein